MEAQEAEDKVLVIDEDKIQAPAIKTKRSKVFSS
jgi:hypothetical protein